MSIFKGSGVALITPFDDDLRVDYKSLNKMINYGLKNNTDAIIICGTTGEAPTLEDEEHLNVIKECIKVVNGKIPVIAGTGSNNTNHAIMMSKEAQKLGANGLLVVTPYYNKATQKGLEKHYEAIANSVDIPILMYNVPSRTGCNINPQTAINILKSNDNVIGIKEASGSIKQVEELAKLSKEQNVPVDLYSGNDDDVISILKNGGLGVISVCANITPKKTHDLVYKYIDGDVNMAKKLQEEQKELSDALFSEVNPIPIKEACYQMGLINSPKLRLPLTVMENDTKENLSKVLKKQHLI